MRLVFIKTDDVVFSWLHMVSSLVVPVTKRVEDVISGCFVGISP